jgi:hypothetical protein
VGGPAPCGRASAVRMGQRRVGGPAPCGRTRRPSRCAAIFFEFMRHVRSELPVRLMQPCRVRHAA